MTLIYSKNPEDLDKTDPLHGRTLHPLVTRSIGSISHFNNQLKQGFRPFTHHHNDITPADQ